MLTATTQATPPPNMNALKKLIRNIDRLQRRQPLLGFSYAVIKKYGDDQAGYQAALLTYYGFLSLFPLLLVLSTVVGLLAGHHPAIQQTVITSLTNYFPILGSQLSEHINTLHKSGLALAIGIIFTLFGARGVASVFRHGVNRIWLPGAELSEAFPKAALKSLSLIIVGGLGFMAASLMAGYAGAVGHGLTFRLLSLLVNVIILFCLFSFLLNISLPRHVAFAEIKVGAAAAAIGLVVLQSVGSYVLAHELKNLDALYSIFAIALGLLFWIYLQAQVLYYAVEIAAVSSQSLWPRAIDGAHPTPVDQRFKRRQVVIEQEAEKFASSTVES